jgi:hypothetical protein
MKKILSVIGLTFLVVNQAIAQRLVLDPALLAATIAGDVAQNNRLDEMKENQTAIERAQKLAQAIKIIDDIMDYQDEIVGIVSDDPKLVVFAVNSQALIVKRATQLSKFIMLIPLQYNDWNVISDTDRKDMLNHIINELRVIRGNAYGLKHQLEWAKNYNYWSKLNPWQGYINQDKQLIEDILTNTKF